MRAAWDCSDQPRLEQSAPQHVSALVIGEEARRVVVVFEPSWAYCHTSKEYMDATRLLLTHYQLATMVRTDS